MTGNLKVRRKLKIASKGSASYDRVKQKLGPVGLPLNIAFSCKRALHGNFVLNDRSSRSNLINDCH